MPKIVIYQTKPLWFVKNKYFMAKIDVYRSLLPSDCVIGWDMKMTSHPNSNASLINIWDRLIWWRSPNLTRSSKLAAAPNCTCVHMHTEDRKHPWLFIVAALRWRHDFPSTIFCIHNVHDKLYCSMNNYRWKCRHFRNVLCHSIKVNWSS